MNMEPDEGIVLAGAQRILAGELPYRDFFTFYTPGSFYLLGFLFRLFGDWFVVARASIAVSGALCSVLTYLLARRVCSRGMSLFMAGLATAMGTGFRFLVLHNWYSTLLAYLALYAAVRLVESKNVIWAFALGLFASLTFLFEQSKGAGVFLGIGGAFLILYLGKRTARFSRRLLGVAYAGIAIPFFVTFAFYLLDKEDGEGEIVLVDATTLERHVQDSEMIVTMNRHGELCQVAKLGGKPVDAVTLLQCINIALAKVQMIDKFISSRLEEESRAKNMGGKPYHG